MLITLDNLVDRDSYHVLVSVLGTVFSRIAGLLYSFFWDTLLLFGVAADDVALVRIVVLPLRLLVLGGIERGGRLESTFVVRQYSVVLAKFCYIDTHHHLYFYFQMRIGVVDFWSLDAVGMMKNGNLRRILFDIGSHHRLAADHCIYIVRKVRTLDNVYR